MKLTTHLIGGIALLGLAACSSDDPTVFDQEDRIARPAVNTLFIHTDANPVAIEPTDGSSPKDLFNAGEPTTDAAQWTSTIDGSLRAFRSLDNNSDNDASGDIDVFTSVLSTDVLVVDLGATGTSTFLGVELGVADSTGGRALSDDVVDAALAAVLFPGAAAPFTSDNVDANDKAFLNTFPYLAGPFTP